LIFAASVPSEKFGTHSTIALGIVESFFNVGQVANLPEAEAD
jgi:hypothetical protein